MCVAIQYTEFNKYQISMNLIQCIIFHEYLIDVE